MEEDQNVSPDFLVVRHCLPDLHKLKSQQIPQGVLSKEKLRMHWAVQKKHIKFQEYISVGSLLVVLWRTGLCCEFVSDRVPVQFQ